MVYLPTFTLLDIYGKCRYIYHRLILYGMVHLTLVFRDGRIPSPTGVARVRYGYIAAWWTPFFGVNKSCFFFGPGHRPPLIRTPPPQEIRPY